MVAHEAGQAARPVAALLRLAAVCVEYAVAKVRLGVGGWQRREHLVEAHASAPVAPTADALRVEFNALGYEVNDHEVVAEAVHFGETELHVRRRGAPRHRAAKPLSGHYSAPRPKPSSFGYAA